VVRFQGGNNAGHTIERVLDADVQARGVVGVGEGLMVMTRTRKSSGGQRKSHAPV
jgi:hypothetical protein